MVIYRSMAKSRCKIVTVEDASEERDVALIAPMVFFFLSGAKVGARIDNNNISY